MTRRSAHPHYSEWLVEYEWVTEAGRERDRDRPFADQREQERRFASAVKSEALKMLSRRLGVRSGRLWPALDELCSELERLARQRRPRPPEWTFVCGGLAEYVRDLVGIAKGLEETGE